MGFAPKDLHYAYYLSAAFAFKKRAYIAFRRYYAKEAELFCL
jgi:hypothetical protein